MDSNRGDQPPPPDLAERRRRKPPGKTPQTGTRPNPTSTIYKKNSDAAPPPPLTGLAGELESSLRYCSRRERGEDKNEPSYETAL
jgi:hypothetical protein